ncbi:MAG: TFIIB-type zinc ribbon-containing protein [Oscillospiraceae bacterium]|jgi:DNA-directed RNA polymerase subunit RPC12/RpoP|nr:TFIIB-type zinc ribbon-containing protein [Oscillospiraceae bacterium]
MVEELNPQNPHADTNTLDKCPNCGATDVKFIPGEGIVCSYCHHTWQPVYANDEDVASLSGIHIAEGAQEINQEASTIITMKCSACGAEVSVDTSESLQARCHWCRHTLSVNDQIPNGAVPDYILPFELNKQTAQSNIEAYVNKRKFYANPQFKAEFSSENIMGVYFPYMLADINGQAFLSGQGEHKTRSYTVKVGKNERRYYDADVYDISRSFDLAVDDLTIESSTEHMNLDRKANSNNIINAILPFPTKQKQPFKAAYLKGFNSEKRDANVGHVRELVEKQTRDIARAKANETTKFYDRGVRWDEVNVQTKGESWATAFLPVWLYSFLEQRKNGNGFLHYVALNACTGEIVGSVPINKKKLFLVSFLIGLLSLACAVSAFLLTVSAASVEHRNKAIFWFLLLVAGPLYYFIIYSRYRNQSKRHTYEKETICAVSNLQQTDHRVSSIKGTSSSTMHGANAGRLEGQR